MLRPLGALMLSWSSLTNFKNFPANTRLRGEGVMMLSHSNCCTLCPHVDIDGHWLRWQQCHKDLLETIKGVTSTSFQTLSDWKHVSGHSDAQWHSCAHDQTQKTCAEICLGSGAQEDELNLVMGPPPQFHIMPKWFAATLCVENYVCVEMHGRT